MILREKCYINLNRNIDNNCTAVLPFVWRTKCMEIANGCSIYRENDGGCVFCGKVKHLWREHHQHPTDITHTHTHTHLRIQINIHIPARCMGCFLKHISLPHTNQVDLFKIHLLLNKSLENESDTQIFSYISCSITHRATHSTLLSLLLLRVLFMVFRFAGLFVNNKRQQFS